MNSISTPVRQPINGEIDLVALLQMLWAQKVLIVSITLLAGILAATYAFMAIPQYQVKSILRPASVKDLDALNGLEIYTLTPDKAIRRVGAALESYDSRLEFFRNNERLFESLREPGRSLEQTFESFNQHAFKMLQPDPKKTDGLSNYVGIELTYPEGVDGVALVNGLVGFALASERERIEQDVKAIIQNRLVRLDSKISAARASYQTSKEAKVAQLLEADALKRAQLQDELKALQQQLKTHRNNRIKQLDEAINIAKSLGIQRPTTPSALGDGERTAQGNVIRTEVNNQQVPLYFMGSDALEAERNALLQRVSDDFTEPRIAQIAKELRLLDNNRQVEVLSQRENEDLFLKDLAIWREDAARLRSLQLDSLDLKLVAIDQAAIEPSKPIKPKKTLILALGLALGGVLGVFIALFRCILKSKSSALNLVS